MKKIILTTLALCLVLFATAQATARQFVLNITPDGASTLTCYLPAHSSGRAIVDCPGGGYSHLAIDHEGHDWAPYFNEKGIAYFVLKYRMPNGDRSIPMGDACQAMRMVRDSAAVWGINPMDVGIMGFSAGGHLASTVSTHAEFDARPNFSILFYPVISMDKKVSHHGSCENFLGKDQANPDLVRSFSNQNSVEGHLTPRAYIIMANDDDVVPPVTNGIAYYTAMRNAGNECALTVYPTGGHGFGFRSSYAFHEQMLSDLSRWLDSFQAPKQNAVRVACIGNSITDGYGIDMAEQNAYPAVLQGKLGEGYCVKNYGVSGNTLLRKGNLPYVRQMAWRDALAFQPDIVVLKLGTNDSKPMNWQYGADFESDLNAMIDTLEALPSNPKIYLATPIPAYSHSWSINDSVIVNGIIPVIKKVARKRKCGLIDLRAAFDDPKLILADGIHPSRKGAARMAELIYEAIKEY